MERENEEEWRFIPNCRPVRRKAPIVCFKVPRIVGSCPLRGDYSVGPPHLVSSEIP